MKHLILTLTIIAVSAAAKAQLISTQHQQIKYDTTYNAYYIADNSNSSTEINFKDSVVQITGDNYQSTIVLSNDNIAAIHNKESITIESVQIDGKMFTVSFWFIEENLEEISYTSSEKITHSFKNISVNTAVATLKSTTGENL